MGKTLAKEKYFLVLILVLGLGLRLVRLDQSFWLDEASQAQLSSLSVSQIWSGRSADFHPPLFYILAHYWLQFGHSEMWLRLLPVGIGVVTIWFIYLLAGGIIPNKRAGLIAALLLAVNPFHIYYSQEFRMYSLLALLGTVSMYLLLKKKYLGVAMVNAAMLYTHYASVLLILAQAVISPITIYYSLFTLVLYLPWGPQFLRQLQTGTHIDQYLPGWREVLAIGPVKAIPLVLFKLVAGRIDFVSRIGYALYIGFVLAVLGVSLVLAKTKRWFLLSWVFVPLLSAIVISLVIPLTQPFRLIFILPALILILTQAVLRFPRLMLLVIMYINVTGMVMYATRPRLQREQWRQAIFYLEQNRDGLVMVKFPDKFAPFYWYASKIPVKSALVLANLTGAPAKIYLLEYLTGLTDPNFQVEKNLRDLGYTQQGVQNFEGVGFIYQYSKL